MGIPVKRTRFVLFVASGVLSAFAGIMLVAKLQAAPPAVGNGTELDALTVVLLGGVAFAGGYGRIGGVIAGLLFVGALRNGLVVIGVSQFLQDVAVGLTLILAIALDGSLRKVIRSSWDKLGKNSIDNNRSSSDVSVDAKVEVPAQ
jgi:ribose/xylose/arabinose/galactoside ABC-type transport system permease subunit